MGGSWKTHEDGAILGYPQAVTLLISHQMLLKQVNSKESNKSWSGLALANSV